MKKLRLPTVRAISCLNVSHLIQFVTFAYVSTHCRLTMCVEVSLGANDAHHSTRFPKFLRGVMTPITHAPQGQMISNCKTRLQWVLSLSLSLPSTSTCDQYQAASLRDGSCPQPSFGSLSWHVRLLFSAANWELPPAPCAQQLVGRCDIHG